MEKIERVVVLISRLTATGGFVAVVALLLLVSSDVVFRYLLNSPLLIAEEVSGYLVAIIGYLGAAETLRRKRHIRIEVFVNWLSETTRLKFDIAAHAIGLIVLSVFTWHVLVFVERSFARGTISPSILAVPLWIPQTAMVLGTTAFLIQLAFDAVQLLLTPSAEQHNRGQS